MTFKKCIVNRCVILFVFVKMSEDIIENKKDGSQEANQGKGASVVSFCKTIFEAVKNFATKFLKQTHKEGYIFVAISTCITIFVSFFSSFFGLLFFFVTLWVIAFFRDPVRVIPKSKNVVVSGADGVISSIKIAKAPADLGLGDGDMQKISVFLSVFNVHVNKFPVSGIVEKVKYHPGKFLSAELDKSSDENERNSLVIKNQTDGEKIVVVQIAGLIAKRIVCFTKEGESANIGTNFGLIRFGSRVDVYLPKSYKILVQEGQTCIGGETVLAAFGNSIHLSIGENEIVG